MNEYEMRQAERKARYAEKAERLHSEAASTLNRARDMASVIPFGQPILVGHHSEGRDRNYRKRIGNTYDKAFQLHNKAEHYERRANTESKAISSDDPAAVVKLKEKIAKAEALQEKMKTGNRLLRKGDIAGLIELLGEKVTAGLQEPDFAGRKGFPNYMLTNNNANIRRMKQRVESLKTAEATPPADNVTGDGWVIEEHADDNRIWVVFDDKPPADVRSILKGHGFKWSPGRVAWVRMLNNAGRYAAEQVTDKLTA